MVCTYSIMYMVIKKPEMNYRFLHYIARRISELQEIVRRCFEIKVVCVIETKCEIERLVLNF